MDSNRPPQSSTLVDLKDPIQVHLLTETALSDSKEYEILSQEEVDGLKKQIQFLTQRGEQTRANLAIQSKYRDAAISMAKLYSPTGGRGDRSRGGDDARQAELEKQASERRCEELVAELFSLDKRLMDAQTRLLQHTAGILQMTHRASSRKSNQPPNTQPLPNGIPGSPESLYTSSNGRDSLEGAGDDIYFDDRSLYFPLDQVDGHSVRPRKNVIEIPMKSPVREQKNQLREEADRLREENGRLGAEAESLRKEGAERLEFIVDTEKKLEDLASKLYDMASRFNPVSSQVSLEPPASRGPEPGAMVDRQLDYLEKGLAVALEEREREISQNRKEAEVAAAAAAATLNQVEGKVEALNRQVHEVLRNMEPDYPSPPEISGQALDEQLDYLQDSFRTVQTELARAAELSSSTSANKQKNDQMEAVLMGLWDIIQAGYAEMYQQKVERRKARAEKGLEEDEDDMSSDESLMSTDEPYSLQAFSTKVQWLYAQATSLKEQKVVLKRQIKQQRELNNKSSSDKDVELREKTDELQSTRDLLDSSEKVTRDTQDKLAKALNDLDTLQQTSAANESAAAQVARDQLGERDAKISSLESSSKDLQAKLSEVETSVAATQTLLAATQAQLVQISDAKTAAEAQAEKLQKEVAEKDEELDRMNIMVVELKTEVTIAKAELDGAYGSRAQRAKEAAALTKSSENSELASQNDRLKGELTNILKELEDMTKETIIAEKEKLELENKLDDVLAVKAGLESEVKVLGEKLDREVSQLKEQLDAERLRVPPSPGGLNSQPRAGASMLSEQFRATMKDERRKFQEEIRVRLCPHSPA